MTSTYAFYQAGMRLYDFTTGDDDTIVTRYDHQPVTNEPLTDALATELGAVMHFDPRTALAHLTDFEEYRPQIQSGRAFTTGWGATYAQRDAHYWMNRHARPALDIIVDDNGHVAGYQQTQRAVTSVLVQPELTAYTIVQMWDEAGMVRPAGQLGRRFTAMVPMHDGTRLATEILLPDNQEQPIAAIMERTPYGRNLFIPDYQRFAHRGYAVIIQDVRGREDSEGDWIPFQYERDDADDTLDWIAQQPWSNGRVGMIGGSYGGYTQWAAAASGNPHLQAIVSMVTAGSAMTDTFAHGGAPSMGQLAWFFAVSGQHFQPELMHRDDWDQLFKVRPIVDIPQHGLGHPIAGYSAYLEHTYYDDFMANTDWHARQDQITVPALFKAAGSMTTPWGPLRRWMPPATTPPAGDTFCLGPGSTVVTPNTTWTTWPCQQTPSAMTLTCCTPSGLTTSYWILITVSTGNR